MSSIVCPLCTNTLEARGELDTQLARLCAFADASTAFAHALYSTALVTGQYTCSARGARHARFAPAKVCVRGCVYVCVCVRLSVCV